MSKEEIRQRAAIAVLPEYVHQLQHVLRICNVNKEIEL